MSDTGRWSGQNGMPCSFYGTLTHGATDASYAEKRGNRRRLTWMWYELIQDCMVMTFPSNMLHILFSRCCDFQTARLYLCFSAIQMYSPFSSKAMIRLFSTTVGPHSSEISRLSSSFLGHIHANNQFTLSPSVQMERIYFVQGRCDTPSIFELDPTSGKVE